MWTEGHTRGSGVDPRSPYTDSREVAGPEGRARTLVTNLSARLDQREADSSKGLSESGPTDPLPPLTHLVRDDSGLSTGVLGRLRPSPPPGAPLTGRRDNTKEETSTADQPGPLPCSAKESLASSSVPERFGDDTVFHSLDGLLQVAVLSAGAPLGPLGPGTLGWGGPPEVGVVRAGVLVGRRHVRLTPPLLRDLCGQADREDGRAPALV